MANTVSVKMQYTRLMPAAAGGVGRVILDQIYDFHVTKLRQLSKRFVQNAAVKKEQSVQCLILCAGGDTLVQSEML